MSDREELIVDILEKVSDKVDKLSIEQARQSVMLENNTKTLNEHERRSTASEDRLALLEDDAKFARKFVKVCAGILTLATVIFEALSFVHR